jgi:histidine triad (HIT) family protein
VQTKSGCIFCQIVAGRAPCHRVAEDERTIVFMDLFPVVEAHTLVVTREHFENLYETPPEAMAAIGAMSQRVAEAIREELAPDGLSVYQANGRAAGQTVFHYHMHLMARAEGSQLTLHGRKQGDPKLLADQAARLSARLRAGEA